MSGQEESREPGKTSAKRHVAKCVGIALLLSLVALVAMAFANPRFCNLMKEIKVHADLPYVQNAGRSQTLDLYLPAAAREPLPVVIFIHGGAWLSGDKKETPSALLAKNGFASASINYRLTSEAIYPAQLDDCLSAVEWIKAHASDYHLDTSRIAVWGGSAGGHLAAMTALHRPNLGIKVACDWCGPTDLETIAEQAHGQTRLPWSGANSPLERLLGGPVANNRALARAASPVNFVSSCFSPAPVFLIVHGAKDDMVPLQQSAEFADALQKSGAKVDYVVVPGGSHNLYTADVFDQLLNFLDKHL